MVWKYCMYIQMVVNNILVFSDIMFLFNKKVTMEFWDGLWLNESFASFMGEVVVPNIIHPEWKSDSEASYLTKGFIW